MPDSELQSQRILKLSYQDSERDGSLKLVLRLKDAERFSLQGSDTFNRSWFRIAVDGGVALVLDQREKSYCIYRDSIELPELPLGPLGFDALPALLLGRLPISPVAAQALEDENWAYWDTQGRRWTARGRDGETVSWILWDQGEPEVYWRREGGISYLSARSQQLQMRWRAGRVETLVSDPDGIDPPPDYALLCPQDQGEEEPL